MDEEVTVVVIDNGTGECKAGFAGNDAPRSVFSTIVGRPKVPGIMVGLDQKEIYMGSDAEEKRGVLKIDHPIQHGEIVNWDDMEKVWHYTLSEELKVSPEHHPILLTESPMASREHRERMTQIMFEVFNVPCFYSQSSAVLALFSGGRTTGVVLDSGQGITHAVPIYEGFSIPSAIEKVQMSGQILTEHMQKLLNGRGAYSTLPGVKAEQLRTFTTPAELDQVQQIKETMTYVVEDFEMAIDEANESKACEKPYVLPDGTKIIVGRERFSCPEILFRPELAERRDIADEGLQKYIYDCIMKSDPEVRREFFKHIMLAGGNTLFPNIAERLWREMNQLAPPNHRCKIIQHDERKYAAWLGGSIHATLSTFQTMWITKQEFDEVGANIVHRKCF